MFTERLDGAMMVFSIQANIGMHQRYSERKIITALQDTPAIMIVGPRQCGKTTLVKQIMGENWTYITLDDLNQLQFAKQDPVGFIQSLTARHIVIDEIQRVQELILPIKQSIDEERTPGRFLLTGSANALALPQVADSLAGRLEVVSLLPFAECEIMGTPSTFLTKVLANEAPTSQAVRVRDRLLDRVIAGGFPEPLFREGHSRRAAWYHQYITSIIQKDMRDLGNIEHLDIMARLVQIFCNYVGCLINYTDISNLLGLPRQTVNRYLQLLEQLFIFQELPAWYSNQNKRLVKTPKAHIVDSGLLCALRRINHEKIIQDPALFGSLLENYVVCELRRLASWCDEPLQFFHYRDKDKVEVDIVIETASGAVIGIEVKASSTVRSQDFQGLERLKKAAGERFLMGLLLYDGDRTNTWSDGIFAAPIGCLWE